MILPGTGVRCYCGGQWLKRNGIVESPPQHGGHSRKLFRESSLHDWQLGNGQAGEAPPLRLLVVSSPGTYVLLLYIAVQLALVTPISFSFPRRAEFVYTYDFGSLPVPAWRECFSSEEIALWH